MPWIAGTEHIESDRSSELCTVEMAASVYLNTAGPY